MRIREVIMDTSALIPREEVVRRAISLILDTNMKLCVTKEILKEYSSKSMEFPGEGGFREEFSRLILHANKTKKCRPRSYGEGKLQVHAYAVPRIDISEFKNEFKRKFKDKSWDNEDEKFLKLFVEIGRRRGIELVVVDEKLKKMAEEAMNYFELSEETRVFPPVAFFTELKLLE